MQLGEYARGGLTRGDHQASEQERGCQEQEVPGGSVAEDHAALTLPCGSASPTRDGIVDALTATWEAMPEQEKTGTRLMQLTRDHGPESSGRRTPWLARMGPLADAMHKPMPWRYSPPSQRKYHPT